MYAKIQINKTVLIYGDIIIKFVVSDSIFVRGFPYFGKPSFEFVLYSIMPDKYFYRDFSLYPKFKFHILAAETFKRVC